MRTLTEMIERVKAHVRAAENLTWKSDDYEAMLVEAAHVMWRQIASGPAAKVLREFSGDVILDSECRAAVPEDCIRIEEVNLTLPPAWVGGLPHALRLEYVKPSMTMPPFPPFSFPFGRPPAWTDDVKERMIRVYGAHPGDKIVFQYIQEPVFPFEDGGTLRDPGATGTDVYRGVPELCDTAVEYLAAALLLGEEVKDDAPIGYNGSQYASYMGIIQRSPVAQPARRYVRRVSRR